MGSPPGVSACRLEIDAREALLDGSPGELRQLATWLSDPTARADVALRDGARVRVDRTDSPVLSITAECGSLPALVIAGSSAALSIVVEALDALAGRAEELGSGSIAVHEHIEYLGEDDAWRDPRSLPLVISCDWLQ